MEKQTYTDLDAVILVVYEKCKSVLCYIHRGHQDKEHSDFWIGQIKQNYLNIMLIHKMALNQQKGKKRHKQWVNEFCCSNLM
jgi:hypothetical protein